MKKESKFVVFSGGCFSGKTTTLEYLASVLKNRGENVIVLSELMRKHNIISIDDIRSRPSEYLSLQNKIIREKIECENSIFESANTSIVLVDRAITDSLFYLLFYVDKSKLTDRELITYNNLLVDTMSHVRFAFKHLYDYIAFFKPLSNNKDSGIFRPKANEIMKNIESSIISMINASYFDELQYNGRLNKYEVFDLNKEHYMDISKRIISVITTIK